MQAIGTVQVEPAATVVWELSRTDALLLQCALTDSYLDLDERFRKTKDENYQTLTGVSKRLREELVALRKAAGHYTGRA
jgi:hypothetical protein